jgi:hypothetical protein
MSADPVWRVPALISDPPVNAGGSFVYIVNFRRIIAHPLADCAGMRSAFSAVIFFPGVSVYSL